MKNVEKLLDELDEIIEQGTSIAFTSKVLVDGEAVKRIIDDIRLNTPEEIKQARAIAADRIEIFNAAKKEGEKIVAKAKEQALSLVEEHVITKSAKEQANELLTQAKGTANLTIAAAQEKADEILTQAKAEAEETTAQAERWSKEMRSAASDFVEEIMRESDEIFTKGLTDIKRVRANLAAAGAVSERGDRK